jgi:hypothetical protein
MQSLLLLTKERERKKKKERERYDRLRPNRYPCALEIEREREVREGEKRVFEERERKRVKKDSDRHWVAKQE